MQHTPGTTRNARTKILAQHPRFGAKLPYDLTQAVLSEGIFTFLPLGLKEENRELSLGWFVQGEKCLVIWLGNWEKNGDLAWGTGKWSKIKRCNK